MLKPRACRLCTHAVIGCVWACACRDQPLWTAGRQDSNAFMEEAAASAGPIASDSGKMGAVNDADNSMLGVVLSVVVVAASLVLLPFSAVTVIMAALAGLWWISTGSGPDPVQMGALSATADQVTANGGAAEAEGPGVQQQVCGGMLGPSQLGVTRVPVFQWWWYHTYVMCCRPGPVGGGCT